MKRAAKPGSLFPGAARSQFMAITRQRYSSMCDRMKRKKLPPPPFTMDEFRAHFANALGGVGGILPADGGSAKCRYCGAWFTADTLAVDHAIPLARGGSQGLENLEFPCARCNSRKGGLTPDEYLALLGFLERSLPFGRLDVLDRLEKAVQSMAGNRFNAGIIGDLKKTGAWQQAQTARRLARKAKQ
jgi:hypothetical protein